MRQKFFWAAALLLGSAALPVSAATPQQDTVKLHQRALAATCANCHGTEGVTVNGSTVPSLAGMPRDYMIKQLVAFRDGSRPATVMHQLVKGLTEEQIQSVATYFATLKR